MFKYFLLFFAITLFNCSVQELDNEPVQINTDTIHGESINSNGSSGSGDIDNSEDKATDPKDDGVIKETDADDDGEGKTGHGEADPSDPADLDEHEEEIGGRFVDPTKVKPPTGGKTQIDPEKDCPPNDRNCNGVPDDEERLNRTGHGDSVSTGSTGTSEEDQDDNDED